MTSFAYPLTGLVTIVTLIVYFWMAFKVGKARAAFGVPAPRMDGPDDFLRVLRVQGNTAENLLLFLPAIWLFALTVGDIWAAAIGIFYPVGRVLYARGYYAEALKRSTGFTVGLASTLILLIGSLIALAMEAARLYL
ncbi:MAG: MAPEG family protein [Alphaproteobacteria bacterium]|nr:MAPEG family protein [Alphaproteobacteria bacterium]MDX5417317.1 MAPEG family protein [Alphaproteobacteria bacterium]MDX5494770.1 MAPEG family protein [Alphaproteobacteria bacterium]